MQPHRGGGGGLLPVPGLLKLRGSQKCRRHVLWSLESGYPCRLGELVSFPGPKSSPVLSCRGQLGKEWPRAVYFVQCDFPVHSAPCRP